MSALLEDRAERMADEVRHRCGIIASRIAKSAALRGQHSAEIDWNGVSVRTYAGTLPFFAALEEAMTCHATGRADIAGDILSAAYTALTDWLEEAPFVAIIAEHEIACEMDAWDAHDQYANAHDGY